MSKQFLIIPLSLFALSVQAANVTQVNRYATVDNKPLKAQVNPLFAVQQVHFPESVKTVGDAIVWWLKYSGYTLAPIKKQPEVLQVVMQHPLPQIDRNLGPLTVKEGLEVLAGLHVFTLVYDPLLREVNFKLNPTFLPRNKS